MTLLEETALMNLTVQAVDPVTGALLFDGQGNPILQIVQVIDSGSAQSLYVQSQIIPVCWPDRTKR